MPSSEVLAQRLSDWYDKHKPDVTSIRVKLTRASCMKWARPKVRGGPLFYRGREIIRAGRKTDALHPAYSNSSAIAQCHQTRARAYATALRRVAHRSRAPVFTCHILNGANMKKEHLQYLEDRMSHCLGQFDEDGRNPNWCYEMLHKDMAKAAAAVYDACMEGQKFLIKQKLR